MFLYRFLLTVFLVFFLSCKSTDEVIEDEANCIGDYSTENVLTNINEEIFNNDESVNTYSRYSWSSNGESRILRGNGIPNHEVGTFPNSGNPNRIREQSVNKNFTLCPSIISENGLDVVGPALVIAYALNSVKFDPGTAGRCNDDGVCSLAQGQGKWNIEALGHDTFDFGDDMNHAHVQPNGAYHYHGIPELLLEFLGDKQGMTIVGWASDGFPVYARYGFSDPNDLNSSVKSLKPSYRLKTEPDLNRPMVLTTLIGGPSQGTTNPNTEIPMGAFTQDYEYVDGLGDLDRCNGRYGVTPEFPDGIYYYVVTDDFPFFTRCLKGDV
ncbi:MAG: YHYH protein [Bacteroidota bacterium]|nr:YHYH protein [Bacteroidota bacterium]